MIFFLSNVEGWLGGRSLGFSIISIAIDRESFDYRVRIFQLKHGYSALIRVPLPN